MMKIDLGNGIFLRWWQKDDAPLIPRYANNRKVWLNLRDGFPHPYLEKHAQKWLANVLNMEPQTIFAISTHTEPIGSIGFAVQSDVYRKSAEIGYWLGEPFWNKGITTKAVKAVTDYVFANFDVVRISAGIFEWNTASMMVLEKNGYVLDGILKKSIFKDGKIIDQYLYAKLNPVL